MNMNMKIKFRKLLISVAFILVLAAILGFIVYDMRFAIRDAIAQGSLNPIELQFDRYASEDRLLAATILTFLHSMLVVFMCPAEWIEVIGAVALGKVTSFAACLGGVLLGNIVLYLAMRKIGEMILLLLRPDRRKMLDETLDDAINVKRLYGSIAALYFVPGIPYGIIAITAISTGIHFYRYLLLTAVCSVPAILLSVLFGSVVSGGNLVWTVIAAILMIIITVLSLIYKDKIWNFLRSRSKDSDLEAFKSNTGHFNSTFYAAMAFLIRRVLFKRFHVHVDKEAIKDIEGPCVLLFNHPSPLDFAWCFTELYPHRVHTVMASYFFYNYKLGRLLHNAVGAFPKMLFEPDVSSLKNICRVIRDGEILTMAPEGRLSPHGALETVSHSTVKLLKKLNVPVYLAKSSGSYLTRPKWADSFRYGRVDVTYSLLFTREELAATDDETLYHTLYDGLSYDDFAWQEENRVAFRCKTIAEGLHKILYICPHCQEEFTMHTKKNKIACSHCGFSATLDPYYQFVSEFGETPKNIRDWFNRQKEIEAPRIADADFKMTGHVTLKMPHPKGKGFAVVGEGETTLDHSGLTYRGTINGDSVTEFFPIDSMPALPFGAGIDFENYANQTCYYFVPDDPCHSVKWSIIEELIYNRYLETNHIQPTR